MNTTKTIYRMSSAGYCPKKLSAIRNRLEPEAPPKWLETAANEGNWHETRIKDELTDSGITVTSEQEEVIIDQPTYQLVGHIDGIIINNDDSKQLLEIKSMSQYEFDRWMKGGFTAFYQYAGQLACYMQAAKLDTCLYIVKNRSSGYIDKRIVKQNENNLFNIESILNKLADIEELALKGELCSMDFDPASLECKRCEFKYLCIGEPKVINGVDKRVLQMAIDKWREGKLLADRGKELINSSKKVLEAYAKEQPEKRFVFNKVIISVYEVNETQVSYTRKPYTVCKVTDTAKEDNND